MLSKDDEDSLRAWANNHVVVGMVQARQTLALLEELDRLRQRVTQLEGYLDQTADGTLVCEAEKLYCPECGNEIPDHDQNAWVAVCWHCKNPDDYNEPPLPLSYGSCLAKPKQLERRPEQAVAGDATT